MPNFHYLAGRSRARKLGHMCVMSHCHYPDLHSRTATIWPAASPLPPGPNRPAKAARSVDSGKTVSLAPNTRRFQRLSTSEYISYIDGSCRGKVCNVPCWFARPRHRRRFRQLGAFASIPWQGMVAKSGRKTHCGCPNPEFCHRGPRPLAWFRDIFLRRVRSRDTRRHGSARGLGAGTHPASSST